MKQRTMSIFCMVVALSAGVHAGNVCSKEKHEEMPTTQKLPPREVMTEQRVVAATLYDTVENQVIACRAMNVDTVRRACLRTYENCMAFSKKSISDDDRRRLEQIGLHGILNRDIKKMLREMFKHSFMGVHAEATSIEQIQAVYPGISSEEIGQHIDGGRWVIQVCVEQTDEVG